MNATTAEKSEDAEALAAKHAPLQLASGSYDLTDLEALGRAAAEAKPEDRQRVVDEGLAQANQRPDQVGATVLPGHRLEKVERVLVDGVERPVPGGGEGETEVVDEVKVIETIQVFRKEHAEEEVEDTGPAFDATAFISRNLEQISDDELRALPAEGLAAVREAEVGARNRSTLLARIDAVAGESDSGAN